MERAALRMTDSPAATRTDRMNVARLAAAQAIGGANATIVFATAAIVGNTLAPDKALATLPISVFVIGTAAATLPVGAIGQRYGRRSVFMAGTVVGILAGLIASLAVLIGSFPLFCVATFFGGAYMAVIATLRFAAADTAQPESRARALSIVMAGGLFSGILGPQLVTFTMDIWPPYLFAATYLGQACVAAVAGLILAGVRLPSPKAGSGRVGRKLIEIARQPRFMGAVAAGVVSYFIMNLLMTSAPLAMRLCGLSQTDANLGIQWHVLAMYGPSFFTGHIIARFGAPRVVVAGLALLAAAAGVGLSGMDVEHFWFALILLGIGWNFGFVGASSMVLECHRPEEKVRVQSLNDFMIFGFMVVGSFASGGLLNAYGWQVVCLIALPPLALAAVGLWATGTLRHSRQPA